MQAIARGRAMPAPMPMIPPATPMSMDSMTNCIMISGNVAPRAFLIPFSLVLSVTETIMMFMQRLDIGLNLNRCL